MSFASPDLVLVGAAAFFVGGLVKGATGMGLPTVAMGMLGAVVSPLTAASLMIVPAFVTNVWQLLSGYGVKPLFVRLWPMMAAIVVGTLVGASFLTGGDVRLTTAALGVALVVYAAFSLFAQPFRAPRRLEPWLGPAVGAATGLVTGCTGVFVVPAVPYLQALGLEKDELVQALGLSFTVSTVALAAGLSVRGAWRLDHVLLSSLAIAPSLVGMRAGEVIRRSVSTTTFRRWFLIALLILGAEMGVKLFFK